ncbi:MAG: sulfotransferase domain-containing protein [Niveispirillum sp.]|uniref:sulfotransferase domain-containing protein n=1 Tax=Niveispirillum sp. TaxID=1917217 RepID=UPI003BA5B9DA
MAFFPPGLVWLASYPKSGNTWMRVLLANLMATGQEPADINNLPEKDMLVGRWRFGDDMLVDADLLDRQELERMRPIHCDFVAASLTAPFFCKTHDRFHGQAGAPALGTGARGAIYLVRDPRDVAVSLCHHASLSLDDAIACMSDPLFCSGGDLQVSYLLGDWANHVSGWTGQRLVRTKAVRYEDLCRDTAATLRDIVTFLEGEATMAEIHRAVAHSSLDALQRQEAARGFRESRPGQKRFFRSGRVGEWQETLTPFQARSIEQRFAPVMARWGYGPIG